MILCQTSGVCHPELASPEKGRGSPERITGRECGMMEAEWPGCADSHEMLQFLMLEYHRAGAFDYSLRITPALFAIGFMIIAADMPVT
jgi:hypothetical protein